ncbi:hypothetical protein BROOK1789C_1690 [Bathymodiolus brooksi thiotrophic gill symbiont]|nr:hypothetical protein BROOK1789C_1690 [Bathymodiolus brooksi thiotrophic gill symbiont]
MNELVAYFIFLLSIFLIFRCWKSNPVILFYMRPLHKYE